MDDDALRPGEQGRHHKAHALAAPGGGESKHMLRPVMTQDLAFPPAEENAGRLEQACCPEVPQACPARRAVGGDATCLTGAKHRASDRQGHGRKSASRGKGRAFDEHPRRIGIEMIPPGEEEVRPIDRQPGGHEPGHSKTWLKAQAPSRPFRGKPASGQHREECCQHLAPEDLGSAHLSRPAFAKVGTDKEDRNSARATANARRRRGSKDY